MGSSPQVRGRRSHRYGGGRPVGAHPRRCGADSSTHIVTWDEYGLIPAGAGQTRTLIPPPIRGGAHPRRCGADRVPYRKFSNELGSSPQVRGRRPANRARRPAPGLIPAGAGQTASSSINMTAWRAHPRRCGADSSKATMRSGAGGSSPQVRGRQEPDPRPRHPHGLIPAGAGQTESRRGDRVPARAHPRRCGADILCIHVHELVAGSSPQVRGRPYGLP